MIPSKGLREIVLESVAISISRCWPARGVAEPPAVVEELLAGWSQTLAGWGAGGQVELRGQLRATAWVLADERDAKAELRGRRVQTEVVPGDIEWERDALRLWTEEHAAADYDSAEPFPEHRADGWRDENFTLEHWKLAMRDERQKYEQQCAGAGEHELRTLRQVTADVAFVYRARHEHAARRAADQCVGALYAARAADGNEPYGGREAWRVIVRALQQRLGLLLSWRYV
ncbi:hypothetical protein [Leucobacter chromiireducens]|uniref:Uncharacterized protein n=1 Tax=Leucobacter chromiireducens subsp. solipictus TaxID=398235 RepID=A0ABS1SG60_9MICO|nr:hypothetical protein [Leucobacter chromiireducens]MBL3679525.1 hypothetical protein [Leucobacter chromiireducens subsp. solipictus]